MKQDARFNDFMAQVDLSPLGDYCREHGRIVKYSRGDRMVQEGNICRYIGFVRSGYFKYTSLDAGGEECVTGFSFEGEVVTDYVRSFLFNQPAMTSIVAGCEAEVIQVPISGARPYMLQINPAFISDTSSVLLLEAYRRYLSIHILTPLQRYAELCKRSGHVVDIVAFHELASYLSISRRQFQRIRESLSVQESRQ